jgi:hypothetical protein
LKEDSSKAFEWEPTLWNAEPSRAREQREGFDQRSIKPLVWTKIDSNDFPEEGVFGHDLRWFISHDIAYVTTFEGDDMVLIQNTYFGFPDPPEWGMAARPTGTTTVGWKLWGYFSDLPHAWQIP